MADGIIGKDKGNSDAIGKIERPSSIAPGTLAAYEREAIVAALEKSKGTRSEAASILNIGVATLYRKIKKYRVD